MDVDPFHRLGPAVALLLLNSCIEPEPLPADEPAHGDHVGNVVASLIPVGVRYAFGVPMEFRIGVQNLSDRESIRWPDMNSPYSWSFGFEPLDPGGYWQGCYGRVENLKSPPRIPLTLGPSKQCSVAVLLPGKWGGWNQCSENPDKTFSAVATDFPRPGRYRVTATWHPFDALRPELQQLPGWGVTTNSVEIDVYR
jgi:hypothetical protein